MVKDLRQFLAACHRHFFWIEVLTPVFHEGSGLATVQVPKGLSPMLIRTRFYHAYIVFQPRIHHASTPVPLMFGS